MWFPILLYLGANVAQTGNSALGSPKDQGYKDFSSCHHPPPVLFCPVPTLVLLTLVTTPPYCVWMREPFFTVGLVSL